MTSLNFMTLSFRPLWLIFNPVGRLGVLMPSEHSPACDDFCEAFSQAFRESGWVGDSLGVVVHCDATGSLVGEHGHHRRDAGPGAHRVDPSHPRTGQVKRPADRAEV